MLRVLYLEWYVNVMCCRQGAMEAAGDKKRVVLVVGGSGYLGLHVLEALAASPCDYTLAYTYHSHPPSPELLEKIPHVLPLPLDLRTGHGLESIFDKLGTVGSFLLTLPLSNLVLLPLQEV